MNPHAATLWPGPRWLLAALLATLAMVGPFSIDTYLPAFAGIGTQLQTTPVHMQQTLSSYLFGFALMNLFHGALSDSLGRRPVVLVGMAVFTLASVGCALAQSVGWLIACRALQGMSAGAGIVVSRAVIRDMFAPADAQRTMAQVTIFFGLAPAIAPIIGGYLFVHLGWRAIFWFLAAIGLALVAIMGRVLPETLQTADRQPLHLSHLLAGYRQLMGNPRFVALVLASGVPFNGLFLYVLSAPVFLGELLHLQPTEFFWFFLFSISGIIGGSWWSGRLAGRIEPRAQIRRGFVIMWVTGLTTLLANLTLPLAAWWALPLVGLFAFGWALMVPVVTLMVLDQVPERRGMASSLQACLAAVANGIVAGVVSPLVMHSGLGLALAALALLSVGSLAWWWVRTGSGVASIA